MSHLQRICDRLSYLLLFERFRQKVEGPALDGLDGLVNRSEIEAQRLKLGVDRAKNDQLKLWQQLASLVGISSLTPVPLARDFDGSLPDINAGVALAEILRGSPEIGL